MALDPNYLQLKKKKKRMLIAVHKNKHTASPEGLIRITTGIRKLQTGTIH